MWKEIKPIHKNSFSLGTIDECARRREVLIFQHDPFEEAGCFAEVLQKQRTSYRTVRLFHGETPTDDWQEIRALIILGGEMRAGDEEKYPFLRWEKRIIGAAIDEGIPILGVGFGAELLATVLGAFVYDGPVKEIGWHSISLSPHGQADRFLFAPRRGSTCLIPQLQQPGVPRGKEHLWFAVSPGSNCSHD
jgi:GMP synthase-like glutamine amidotransferase